MISDDPGFPQGAPTPPGGAPTYDFAKFSWKLHEIERIWAPRGGGAPRAPPKSATDDVDRIGWICEWYFSRDLVSAIKMQCDKFEMSVRTCEMD